VSVRRVAIVTIPPLLVDILREVMAGHLTIEIVAQIVRRTRLEQRLRAARPDFVLIGLRRGESDAIARTVLIALPDTKIIAFSSDVRHVWVHQMRPYRTELHDFSPEALIAHLKGRAE
jgi:DNA-binding NarL/FixJ family response regulator